MSTTEVDTPVEETAPAAPETLEDMLLQVEDGSRFTEGTVPDDLATEIMAVAASLKVGIVSVVAKRKEMAKTLADARRHVLRVDGMPDWHGETSTWKALQRFTYDVAFIDLDATDRERERNAVLAHLNRTYLEQAIRDYVAESTDIEGKLVFPDEEDRHTEAFLFACRRQYVESDLAIPNRYKSPEDKAAINSGPGNGPPVTIEVALKGIDGLNHIIPSLATKASLKSVSDIVKRLTAKDAGAIENREAIKVDLDRISTLAMFALKHLDGRTTEKDANDVADLYWTASDSQ